MNCKNQRHSIHCIVPPHLLEKLLKSTEKKISDIALNTLLTTTHLRGERSIRALAALGTSPDTGRRSIYDCRHGRSLQTAKLARTEDGAASSDAAVNRAFDGFGFTRDFYKKVLNRNSIDDRGMRLNGYVHFGSKFQNAFWDGQEMVFGDGDGEVFGDFTLSVDVIAHELTHGVTEFTANLEYHNESGALNESISDVFGSLVKQWVKNQTASDADWLIGAEVFTPATRGDALRSMKAPGTAYDNERLGKDPQPDHMDRFVKLPDTENGDFGGVHINSGIPNKAFYLVATGIGGHAWEAPGHIWYEALKASTATTTFQEFAETTHAKARQLYGSTAERVILDAWREVGIRIPAPFTEPMRTSREGYESYVELSRQVERLADQVRSLSRDVARINDAGTVSTSTNGY